MTLATTDGFHERDGVKHPCTIRIDDDFFFVIAAQCAACSADYLLFDSHQHGWNGFVVSQATKSPPPLIPWRCPACDQAKHQVSIGIAGEPMRTAIEESGELLDESNWQEGFGWIIISTTCLTCRRQDPEWVGFETM